MPAGKKWEDFELRQLALSWIHVSEDAVTGTEQKATAFWTSIHQHWLQKLNGNSGNVRSVQSLKNKWTEMSAHCNKFGAFYTRVVRNKRSGTTQEDWKSEALQLFQQHVGVSFSYFVSYEVLQRSEKFSLYSTRDNAKSASVIRPKTQFASSSSSNSVQNGDSTSSDADVDAVLGTPAPQNHAETRNSESNTREAMDENEISSAFNEVDNRVMTSFQRPIGRKAAKESQKESALMERMKKENIEIKKAALELEKQKMNMSKEGLLFKYLQVNLENLDPEAQEIVRMKRRKFLQE